MVMPRCQLGFGWEGSVHVLIRTEELVQVRKFQRFVHPTVWERCFPERYP